MAGCYLALFLERLASWLKSSPLSRLTAAKQLIIVISYAKIMLKFFGVVKKAITPVLRNLILARAFMECEWANQSVRTDLNMGQFLTFVKRTFANLPYAIGNSYGGQLKAF